MAGSHALADANMVGDGSAACPNACTDDGSFGPAQESAYDGPTDRRADYDLCARVVAMIVCALGCDRAFMARGVDLSHARHWNRQSCGESET